jgi:glyoxylase-like metal-dependent hydrolase (beta-lactamase superfamily II)
MVNIYMVANSADNSWVLIDAGLKTGYPKIKAMAARLFGADSKPAAILLTHGHFDHVGSLKLLADEWQVPVYAHKLERPYLVGKSSYPPADPTVGGGLMSLMSWAYPSSPIELGNMLETLPVDGSVPFLPEWTYYHTPGHTPGHVSFFRKEDGILIAGDAFVTTKSESLVSVLLQSKTLSGPPKYFTTDWNLARKSVQELARLQPTRAATGHGSPMAGQELSEALNSLSQNFYKQAVPPHGRYVHAPAVANENGVVYVPPSRIIKKKQVRGLALVSAAVVLGFVLYKIAEKKYRQSLA